MGTAIAGHRLLTLRSLRRVGHPTAVTGCLSCPLPASITTLRRQMTPRGQSERASLRPRTYRPIWSGTGRAKARAAVHKANSGQLLDLLDSAMAAGMAVELLLRALLAAHANHLLADKGDAHTVLMLSGKRGATQRQGYLDARSLGVSECMRTLKNIPGVAPLSDAHVQRVLAVRNSATHMGIVSESDPQSALSSLVEVVQSLLPALGVAEVSFWGDIHGYAQTLRSAHSNVVRSAAELKKLKAMDRVEKLRGSMDGDYWDEYVSQVQAQVEPDAEEPDEFLTTVACPVCSEDAWLSGRVERTLHVYIENMHDFYKTVERTGHPQAFICGVCGLELEGTELAAVQLDEVLELGEDESAPELDQDDPSIDVKVHNP